MDSEKHWFIDSGYVGIGDHYQIHSQKAVDINTSQSVQEFRFLNFAHRLLLGLIGSMLEIHQGRPVAGDEKTRRRFVLTAAFVQGIPLCQQAVLSALYLQAGNLLRQEFECLALLREIESGKRKDGKQVHAKHAHWNGSRHYGELSALAHLSDHKILESAIQYNTTWGDFSSMIPQYQRDNTKRLYGFHIAMVLDLVFGLRDLYSDMFGFQFDKREQDVLSTVIGILTENETLRTKKETGCETPPGEEGIGSAL